MQSSVQNRADARHWLLVAGFVLVAGGLLALAQALAPMAVQDDMLQHVVWFRRWLPEGAAFVGDPVGEFFVGTNTALYRSLFAGLASIGVDPVTTAWGVAILCGALMPWGTFMLLRSAGAEREEAAIGAALMALSLFFRDDTATGTARTMGWPLLVWALWAATAGRPIIFGAISVLAALLYPPVVPFVLAVVGLIRLFDLWSTRQLVPQLPWAAAVVPPIAIVVLDTLTPNPWGAMLSGAQAAALPDFHPGGRTPIFGTGWVQYWLLDGSRTGLIAGKVRRAWPVLAAAIPGLFLMRQMARQERVLLAALTIAGLVLWAAAHATLFLLYLPSRFTTYALAIIVVALAARSVAVLVRQRPRVRLLAMGVICLLPLVLPTFQRFPRLGIEAAKATGLVRVIANDRGPGMVMGTAKDVSYVPVNASRSIYWAREPQFPYRDRFRRFMNDRLRTTVAIESTPDEADAVRRARALGIRFLMVEPATYEAHSGPPGWYPTLRNTPGAAIPARTDWSKAWVLHETRCRRDEAGVRLFDLACLDAQGHADR